MLGKRNVTVVLTTSFRFAARHLPCMLRSGPASISSSSCSLKLGERVFPPPGENSIESVDVLFSLAVAFVFAFMVDVNSLLGQNVLLNFDTGRYYAPARNRGCSSSSTWRARRDWPSGWVRSPFIACSMISSSISPSRLYRRAAKPIAILAMS
jgi:hypothetical protein